MAEQTRGDDAGDHAPRPKGGTGGSQEKAQHDNKKQDAPNYDKRVDDGRAVAKEDVSSANDE